MLMELGYSAVSASNGEEAVEYLKTGEVDLLLLDMMMGPGMDGLDTYQKIIELHPGEKAIIASGFSVTNRLKKSEFRGRHVCRKTSLAGKNGPGHLERTGKRGYF